MEDAPPKIESPCDSPCWWPGLPGWPGRTGLVWPAGGLLSLSGLGPCRRSSARLSASLAALLLLVVLLVALFTSSLSSLKSVSVFAERPMLLYCLFCLCTFLFSLQVVLLVGLAVHPPARSGPGPPALGLQNVPNSAHTHLCGVVLVQIVAHPSHRPSENRPQNAPNSTQTPFFELFSLKSSLTWVGTTQKTASASSLVRFGVDSRMVGEGGGRPFVTSSHVWFSCITPMVTE